jgi:myo-inositol-1-phosphate synthase
MGKIGIGIIGVGNCASALLQGLHFYRQPDDEAIGLLHPRIGEYWPADIEVRAAYDIDQRKIGRDVHEAIFAPPNCTATFCGDLPPAGVRVRMGAMLDGVSPHMRNQPEPFTFVPARAVEPGCAEVAQRLREAGVQVLLNYLPVGSERAARFYAEAALEAGAAFINCMPTFIASDPYWVSRFEKHNLPVIGDDIKSQLGATIVHRQLTDLFRKRGVNLERTYQLNTGGNTDFLNMLNRSRLTTKKISKTEAVQAVSARRLPDRDIHVGPSDYVPWQKDRKICFMRMEGRIFGHMPVEIELRMTVEDSPNSAGVAIDAIRCCRLAMDRGQGGVLYAPSAYFCKHPPRQFTDDEAYRMTEAFIRDQWGQLQDFPERSAGGSRSAAGAALTDS